MKHAYIFLVYIFIYGCTNVDSIKNNNTTSDTLKINKAELKFVHLNKLSVTGDFDGDGKKDTLVENNISGLNKMPIDSIPNYSEWDSLARYFDSIESDLILSLINRKCDTLHLGSGQGLFCLINIGDNNNDKKDEIALVVDHCTFTNICTCHIYSLCDNKWIELKYFIIHRDAFEYDENSKPYSNGIKGFLELRKNKWMYIDYYDWFEAKSEKDTVLKPLKIKSSCI
ncbi:MAG: hypothetical protein WCK02_10085 [Bacteroidota bacterium]